MKSVLLSCLCVAALLAGIKADCDSSCQSFCEFFDANCVVHPFLPIYGVDCRYILAGCVGDCNNVFCPCQAAATQNCDMARSTCINDGGDALACQGGYTQCLASASTQCLASGISGVIGVDFQTLSAEFHMPFGVFLNFQKRPPPAP